MNSELNSSSGAVKKSVLLREGANVFWVQHQASEVIAAWVEHRPGVRRHLESVRIPVANPQSWRIHATEEPFPKWAWNLSDQRHVEVNGRELRFGPASTLCEHEAPTTSFPHDWTEFRAQGLSHPEVSVSARVWKPRILGGLGLPRLAEYRVHLGSQERWVFRGLQRWFGEISGDDWKFVLKRGAYRIEGKLHSAFKDCWTYRTEDATGSPFFVSQNFFASLHLNIYKGALLSQSLEWKDQVEVESGNSEKLPTHEDIR